MTQVIRDREGRLINIGPWDHQVVQVETGLLDAAGDPLYRTEASNPLPDGAYEDTAEIVTGWDGGLYEAGDPRRLPPD